MEERIEQLKPEIEALKKFILSHGRLPRHYELVKRYGFRSAMMRGNGVNVSKLLVYLIQDLEG